MTKAQIVDAISKKTGIEKIEVSTTMEAFFSIVKNTLVGGDNVYIRGFGGFKLKKRARKTARNITKNTTMIIPAHHIPHFKPAKIFINKVKSNSIEK